MKKILAILLCLIMVVAAAVPVFAADPGTVVVSTSNGLGSTVVVYSYASDAEAVQNGAIARFDNTNGTKYYVKDLATLFGFGGGDAYNTSRVATMLVSEYNSGFADKHLLALNTRKLTLKGAEGGTVINTPTRFRFDCKSGGQLTLENITINATSANTSMAIQLNPDGGATKLVLKNSTVKAADDAKLVNGVIVMNAKSELVLESGAKVLSTKPAESGDTYVNCGVRLNADGNKLTVKDGAQIKTSGSAIVINGTNGLANIEGGTFESGLPNDTYVSNGKTVALTNKRTIQLNNSCTVNINGGTFKTCEDYMFLVNNSSAKLNINGGTFNATGNGLIAAAKPKVKINVTSGDFTASNSFYFINNATYNSEFTMSGGTVTAGGAFVSAEGTADGYATDPGHNQITFKGTTTCTTTGSNGFDIYGPYHELNIEGGTYRVNNGKVFTFSESTSGKAKDPRLNISGGSFYAGGTPGNEVATMPIGSVIWSWIPVTIKIDGGYFYTETGKAIMRLDAAGCNVEVNGGTFEHHGPDAILQVLSSTMTINGGDFIGSNSYGMVISNGDNCLVTVNGGNYYSVTKGSHTGVRGVFRQHNTGSPKLVINNATVYGATDIFASTSNNATADTFKGGNVAIKPSAMVTGAAVRTAKDSSGIRFQSKINKTVVDAIAAIDADYVIGTLIVPYDYLVDGEGNTVCEFSKATLDKAGKQYLNIVAEDGINDKGTYYLINAAMKNISEANYDRDFVAVAYITYKTANGTITIYSAWNEKNNVRNIEEVAYSALADVKLEGATVKDAEGADVVLSAENAYELGYNVVTEWYEYDMATGVATAKTGVAYTEYSAAQREVFEKYIGKANA